MTIHLSVVATSRNDDHGDNLLSRMQRFIDGFILQSKRHRLQAELILVEWNPPPDRKPLADVLSFPKDKDPCIVRIITVPATVHDTLQHADVLPLFQMIAKNVGIRRAQGEYVLATNIDILFSDAVMQFMQSKLKSAILYRADRCDVPSNVTVYEDFQKTLAFCEAQKFRINGVRGTRVKINGHWKLGEENRVKKPWLKRLSERALVSWRYDTKIIFCKKFKSFFTNRAVKLIDYIKKRLLQKKLFHKKLHTNACGDFTLLSRKDWFALRGYPEWPMFSWHLDSVLLYQAHHSGLKEIDLSKNRVIYHIEHATGSGYTPEGVGQLFKRLDEKKLPYFDNLALNNMLKEMNQTKQQGKCVMYNSENWGFSDHVFTENTV